MIDYDRLYDSSSMQLLQVYAFNKNYERIRNLLYPNKLKK